MESWVYIFSRFTQEALLFEALLIFIGCAAYAAFFIVRRRKYGVAGPEIPANIVKAYLAQLVADAEDLRTQLFGLLGKGTAEGRLININILQGTTGANASASASASAPTSASSTNAEVVAGLAAINTNDPVLQQKLKELEEKMQEQAKALDAVLNEKMRLEEELAVARKRAAEPGAAPASGQDNALAERLKTLEAQLAEYAVIEDDLANLKRLQKENKQLRTQLEEAQAGGAPLASAQAATTPAAAKESEGPVPAAAPEAPQTAAKAEEPAVSGALDKAAAPETRVDESSKEAALQTRVEKTAAPLEVEGPAGPQDAAPTEAKPAEPAAAQPNPPAEQSFEALVDDVEKSLAKEATPAPQPEAAEKSKIGEKSEEELQADFEKMLRS